MNPEGSVTNWFQQLEAGQQEAAQKLWERYFARLVGLARKKLQGQRRAAADEEDVALGAFDSFCRGALEGRFPDLHDRAGLWKLLVVITARKAADQIVHERRAKRGGGMIVGESGIAGPASDQFGIDYVIGAEPTPEFAAQVAEQYRQLLDRLGSTERRRIAELKLEGHSHQEIAAMLKIGVRTVERRVGEIRALIDQELAEPQSASRVEVPPANAWCVTLQVTGGVHTGRSFRFDRADSFVIGRSVQAHLRLPDDDKYFSRSHCRIEIDPPRCRIIDLKSRNGTFVNDEQITACALRDGDQIRVGRTILRVAITRT